MAPSSAVAVGLAVKIRTAMTTLVGTNVPFSFRDRFNVYELIDILNLRYGLYNRVADVWIIFILVHTMPYQVYGCRGKRFRSFMSTREDFIHWTLRLSTKIKGHYELKS